MTKQISVWFSKIIWRLCALFMSVFFSLKTYVQINDPDADLWMKLYFQMMCHVLIIICPESSLWRRTADRHVLLASTFGLILGWKLYKEGITDIFQQEEERLYYIIMSINICLIMSFRGSKLTVFLFISWIFMNTELRKHWPERCTTAL
ncbi:transmembrane protein 220 [Pseudorasbora parva]|uniref:transmembrane protein 220 n=1 Tax=Pseudorasbora parva TaxID=51549 RepID=UPI00351F5459